MSIPSVAGGQGAPARPSTRRRASGWPTRRSRAARQPRCGRCRWPMTGGAMGAAVDAVTVTAQPGDRPDRLDPGLRAPARSTASRESRCTAGGKGVNVAAFLAEVRRARVRHGVPRPRRTPGSSRPSSTEEQIADDFVGSTARRGRASRSSTRRPTRRPTSTSPASRSARSSSRPSRRPWRRRSPRDGGSCWRAACRPGPRPAPTGA